MVAQIYPNPENLTGLDSLAGYVSGVEPLAFLGIILVIGVITFLATKNYSSSRAFTFSSFLMFVLSAPIVMMGWLAPRYMYLFLLFTAIGWGWIRVSDSYG